MSEALPHHPRVQLKDLPLTRCDQRSDTAPRVVIPLVVLAGGTTAIGVYASYRLDKVFGASLDMTGALRLAACVAIGAPAMFAAIGASGPLLRRVTADPAQSAD